MKENTIEDNLENPCTACGQKDIIASKKYQGLCQTCINMAELLKENPETFDRLTKIAGITAISCLQSTHVEQEMPDVLDGVRHRTTDRERNTWYVSISELEGNPVEIFASTAFDRDQHLQSRISNLTTITRLISLILRHIFMGERLTLNKTLTQLKRSSRLPNDLPDMLGKILANYSKEPPVKSDEKSGEETIIP